MQNYKINIKIQSQTPRKSEQQQMKAFYCTTLLYMLYGTGKKDVLSKISFVSIGKHTNADDVCFSE